MTKNAESLKDIYIVSFNKTTLCEHREKTMLFRRTKNV